MSAASGESASPVLRTHLRGQRGPAGGHVLQRADQLVERRDPLLEQVAQPGHAVGEQLEGVVVLDVLRQHHDADARVPRADLLGRLDALVAERRRHPDVGDDGVRAVRLDGGEQRRRVGDGVHQLHVVGLAEQGGDAGADQVVVVGEHHPQRHGVTVSASRPA